MLTKHKKMLTPIRKQKQNLLIKYCSGGREKLLGKYSWPKLSSFIYEGRHQG